MLIDWFTVGAQALNFLILVWLMKRFLYKPILNAIDAREKRIASELADAAAKQAEAQKERDEFQHKNEAFENDRVALLKKASDAANGEQQRLLDEAHKDADALRAKRRDELNREQQNLGDDIARWTQKEVFSIARKTLMDLASISLEGCMCEAFVHRLTALTDAAKDQFAASLKSSIQPARVRSAFDLTREQQAGINKALNDAFSADIPTQFETVPELGGGIELSVNGQKVAWSIADYLAALQKSAGDLLREGDKAESKPEALVEIKPEPTSEAKTKPEPEPVLTAA